MWKICHMWCLEGKDKITWDRIINKNEMWLFFFFDRLKWKVWISYLDGENIDDNPIYVMTH